MAEFDLAIEIVLENEGGWVDSADDTFGGETFRGISRRNWPNLEIWRRIDEAKREVIWLSTIQRSEALLQLTKDFYRREFWNQLYDEIDSQELASKLLDVTVNLGIRRGVRILQQSLASMCSGPIVADGRFGIVTLDMVNSVNKEFLMLELRARMAFHYADCKPEIRLGLMRRAVQ
jgi:lysozyme family protein